MKFLQRFGIGAAALLLLACLPGCHSHSLDSQGRANGIFALPDEVLKAHGILKEQLAGSAKQRFE